jgi:hypothetical protein
MNRLALLLAIVTSLLVPVDSFAQTPTRIEDVKQLAGDWEGWIGNVLIGIKIKEDGSYEGFGAGGRPSAGRIVVKDGRASYKDNLSEGSVYLYQRGDGSTLRFVTASGRIGEVELTK